MLVGTLSHAAFNALTTHANRLKSNLNHNTINPQHNERNLRHARQRVSRFNEETRVSRFYSGDNNIVIATASHDAHTHEDITHIMRKHGWALYDVGGNCEYHMFTFKRKTP